MYQYKQDLAMAYFPGHSKESAGKRFAYEIHSDKSLKATRKATDHSRPSKYPLINRPKPNTVSPQLRYLFSSS